jgi:hypothetical protein
MAQAPPRRIIGRTFDNATDARAAAAEFAANHMKVRVFGPARRARIEGAGADSIQWPADATTDRYLVIATDSTVETPPGSQ